MTSGVLEKFGTGNRFLVAIAAPIEFKSVLKGLGRPLDQTPPPWQPVAIGPWDLLLTGVSKSNAAGAVAMHLDPQKHAAVLSIGIAGAYPAAAPLPLGSALVGTRSVMADDGVIASTGFTTCAKLGFPLGLSGSDTFEVDAALLALLRPLMEAEGPIATVSGCAGTDALAHERAERTGAVAEGMEGAAVGLVAARRGVAFVEIRTISNTTGERAGQRWNIPLALSRLTRLVAAL